jgi:hypothetical protein
MTQYRQPVNRQETPYESVDPLSSGLFPGDDWLAEQQSKKWQILPPMVTGGRIPAVNRNHATSPLPISPSALQPGRESSQQAQRSVPLTPQGQDTTPVCRVSFIGQDQQWYSINVGRSMSAQAQPFMQAQPLVQASPALPTAWHEQWAPDYRTSGYAQSPASGQLAPVSRDQQDEATSSKDFLLQIVQPGLAGLMDGSVSTLAPIFSVAFATHQSFTTFLVGMASALGAGISMTFSEALSDDGDITGRGKPFVRGGVTGLMTFISGAGHALPFLISNIQLALVMAYLVVAVELLVIAAIRHKFFGTSWWLSIVQVVGGGALVFVAAILLGNA